ncbi:hypothetical protein [Desulfurispira natronophila]|uniref:CobQ/CobB/MinD/ParA nucleotide binding domain-containing protein n=1 Tax=Desulfurispira natronophila TaxID=682562 RepID=A0A7W7Y5C6_9BACT|nr:hypothetical protein [Desulfurispira natronophila]MBB5022209.1 hypothetical protein [Desulfurispira natronophila]
MFMAITHPRNGTFRTTTAVNIAACLGVYEKRTLVVDVAGGDVSRFFGVSRQLPGLGNMYRSAEALSDYVVATEVPGVDLLPFGTGSFAFGMFWESLLEELCHGTYDFVVLDVNLNVYPPVGARYWDALCFVNHRSPYQDDDIRAMESTVNLVSGVADMAFRLINIGEYPPAVQRVEPFAATLPLDSSIRRYHEPVVTSLVTSHLSRSFLQLTRELIDYADELATC